MRRNENSHFEGKNAFFATISLFLDSPLFFLLSFFFTCGNHSYDEYAISKNMLLENMKKKLRVGVNERRQIQSKLTEMLMVERQIDADSTNLAKTNKS